MKLQFELQAVKKACKHVSLRPPRFLCGIVDDKVFPDRSLLACRKRQKTNQVDLLTKVNQETLRLLNKQKSDPNEEGGSGRKISEAVSYKSLKEIPPTSRMAIQVASSYLLSYLHSLNSSTSSDAHYLSWPKANLCS